jgi:hypothetical protein
MRRILILLTASLATLAGLPLMAARYSKVILSAAATASSCSTPVTASRPFRKTRSSEFISAAASRPLLRPRPSLHTLRYITVPAGTRLVIRTVETVDTRQHGAGHRFRGQLEGAIVVDGVTVAPRGTFVHGVISAASRSGNVAGSSQLSMEFTDIMIDDQLFPIATTALNSQTSGEGGRTVARTARAAAIGGLIDGSKGARTGAKVGAGVSILTAGASINVPRGTLLETTLRTPLVLQ